uniref:Uncharacterized protein n=1 Tax=Schistocephalus solidus TaxID=70667 RepID=A0A0V0JAK0_SCHSO
MSNGTDHKVRRVAVATLVLFIVNVPLGTSVKESKMSQTALPKSPATENYSSRNLPAELSGQLKVEKLVMKKLKKEILANIVDKMEKSTSKFSIFRSSSLEREIPPLHTKKRKLFDGSLKHLFLKKYTTLLLNFTYTRKMHESQSQMDSISNEFTDSVRISKIETPLLKPLSSSDEPPLIIRKGTDIRNEIDVYCKGYDCEVRKRLNRITTDSVPNHTVFYALNADANSQGSGVPQMAQLVNITMQHTAKREKTLSEVDYRSNINTLLDAVSTIKLSEARYGTLGGSSDLNIALPVDRSLHLTAEFLEVTPSFRSEEGEKKLQIFQTGTSADSSPVLRIQELFSHLNSKGNSVPDGVLKSSLASLSLPVNKYRNPLFDSSKGQKFNKKYLHPSPVDKMEDVNLPQRKCVKRRKSVNLDLLNADAITSDMANAASSTAEQKIACASVSHSHKKIDFINKVYKYPRELKSFGSIFNNFNPQKTYQQKSHFNDLEVTNPNYGYDMPTWSSSREIEPIEVPSTPEDSSKYFTDNQEDSNSDDDISATNESPNSLSSTNNESNPENAGSINADDMTTWSSSGEIEPNEVISTSEDSRKYFTVNQEDSNSDDDISATNESPNSLSSTSNESNPENAGSTNANDMTTWSSSGEIEPNEVTSTSDDSPKYFTRREGDSDSNDTINKTNDSLTFMPRQENLIPVNTPADSTPNQHISTLPTLTSSTSTSTPSRSSLRVQSNLPPFFWRTNTTKDVLPPDYFMESEMAKDQKQSTSQSHKNPIKPLFSVEHEGGPRANDEQTAWSFAYVHAHGSLVHYSASHWGSYCISCHKKALEVVQPETSLCSHTCLSPQ